MPSPAEILHGRSLMTGEPVTVDHAAIKAVPVDRQIRDSLDCNKSHRVKIQRALVLEERCWGTGTNNQWTECYITGIDEENRCYQVVFEDTGRTLRCTRSHLEPHGPNFPHISEWYLQQNQNLVTSEGPISGENSVTSAKEGENWTNQASNWVLSGPPPSLERDTAVSLISDAPEERTVTFPDNPVSQTRYIPLRLCSRPPQPKLPFDACPIDLMTPATDVTPRLETEEQREEDCDNVPDTGSNAESSMADTSSISESSPGSSSTMETGATTDMASSETSSSTSSSKGSAKSDSTPSAPPSPRWTITPCTEEAMTAKVSSGPPSPSPADSSLEVRQFYRDQKGHALTCSEFQKRNNQAKQRAAVLKQVAQLECNQIITNRNKLISYPHAAITQSLKDIQDTSTGILV